MACAAAAFSDVTAYKCRGFAPGDYRRTIFSTIILGLGSAGAVGLAASSVTITAAWLLAASFAANPGLKAIGMDGLGKLALASPRPRLASSGDLFAPPATVVATSLPLERATHHARALRTAAVADASLRRSFVPRPNGSARSAARRQAPAAFTPSPVPPAFAEAKLRLRP
ncbi:MAG: hypothetical protein ACREH9_04600, partial [Pseudomonadota bacterium]